MSLTLKQKAHKYIERHIKIDIVRPNLCQKCGKKGKRIEAHHPNYEKFDVIEWLCPSCHALIHRVRGEKHHKAKLTNENIKEIRNMYQTKLFSLRKIAKMFNIKSVATIFDVVHKNHWQHVPEPPAD